MKLKMTYAIGLGSIILLILALNSEIFVDAQDSRVLQPQDTKQGTQEREIDYRATPVVAFEFLDQKRVEINSPREIKNRKYDKSQWVLDPTGARGASEAVRYIEYRYSDIPAKESNVILIGTVLDSQAFLSNDSSGVYSEFMTQIETVFKNKSKQNLNSGEVIAVEREGGIVRYSEGNSVRYKIPGRGSPVKNSKYIFFLKENTDNSLEILTAYELRGDVIFPLDGSRLALISNGTESIFDRHRNESIQSFLEQLKRIDTAN